MSSKKLDFADKCLVLSRDANELGRAFIRDDLVGLENNIAQMSVTIEQLERMLRPLPSNGHNKDDSTGQGGS